MRFKVGKQLPIRLRKFRSFQKIFRKSHLLKRSHSLTRCILIAACAILAGCVNADNSGGNVVDGDGSNGTGVIATPNEALLSAPQSSSSDSVTTIRFGVLTIDGAVSVNRRYRPLLNYLEEKTGYRFELVLLNQNSQFSEVQSNNIDFITNNPMAAVQIQHLHETEFLVTTSRPNTGTQLGAVIVVRDDSGIEKIDDLKNKKAACVNFETAAAGCAFQLLHLKKNDFHPFKEFNLFVENPSQDNIVLSVLNNTIDVGFVRTGQLEKMQANGQINDLSELRVLDRVNDNFFYDHTTALYPEWPVAALKDTDPAVVEAVREALLEIPEGHSALQRARFDGFVEPVDYSPIQLLIDELRLRSWSVNG